MTKLCMQNVGQNWAFGIRGDNTEEVEHQFFSFVNHGATNGELLSLGLDTFRYFWSTPEKVLAAMEKAELSRLLNKLDERFGRYTNSEVELTEETPALIKLAKENAKKKFDQIEEERFIKQLSSYDVDNQRVM